jgi:hypothetical protein
MYATDLDHCEIVVDSLTGARSTDEQTFTSIGILTDRLENIRKMHHMFMDIEFSPDAKALAEQEMKLAVS